MTQEDKDIIVDWAKKKLASFDPNEITSGRYELIDLINYLDTLEVKDIDLIKDSLIKKVKKWLSEIHRVCDITDENGYRIELRELQARFEKYIKEK